MHIHSKNSGYGYRRTLKRIKVASGKSIKYVRFCTFIHLYHLCAGYKVGKRNNLGNEEGHKLYSNFAAKPIVFCIEAN